MLSFLASALALYCSSDFLDDFLGLTVSAGVVCLCRFLFFVKRGELDA